MKRSLFQQFSRLRNQTRSIDYEISIIQYYTVALQFKYDRRKGWFPNGSAWFTAYKSKKHVCMMKGDFL